MQSSVGSYWYARDARSAKPHLGTRDLGEGSATQSRRFYRQAVRTFSSEVQMAVNQSHDHESRSEVPLSNSSP